MWIAVNDGRVLGVQDYRDEFCNIQYDDQVTELCKRLPTAYLYNDGSLIVDQDHISQIKKDIRIFREYECFRVINRSMLWYNTLSPEQVSELNIWYQAWLEATDTLVIPEKLSWL